MIYKRGSVYWYEFCFRGRRFRKSTGLTNKNAAIQAEAKKRTQLAEGEAGIHRPSAVPAFKKFLEVEFTPWDKSQHEAHPRTHKRYMVSSKVLVQFFGKLRLNEITPALIEKYKMQRRQQVREAGVNRDLAALRLMLNFATIQGHLHRNPFKGVKLLQEGAGAMRILSHEEEQKYLEVASKTLRDVAILMLETGMRPEEVFNTLCENVHLDRQYLHIPRGKTRFARRNIPLSDRAISVVKPGMKGVYIFPNRLDRQKPLTTVQKMHDKARKTLGFNFRLYDLRHTFGTRSAMAGVDLATLRELMGHASISMTMRYVHPTTEHKREAVKKLERFNTEKLSSIQGSPQKSPQSVVYSS